MNATNQYLAGEYGTKHPDWHLGDAPGKAQDVLPGILAALRASGGDDDHAFRLADLGAGAGGVLVEVLKHLKLQGNKRSVEGVGFEISPQAIELGKAKFPELDLRQKFFDRTDGPFDAVMLIDVLEHVENPWELLREAAQASRFLIVRQPLLESFSTFRHDNYRGQREQWGHIGFFNIRSFLDLAAATGWKPLKTELLAPWQLAMNHTQKPSWLHRALVRFNRPLASHLISGFYLNGAFERVQNP